MSHEVPSILLVDDDRDLLHLISMRLTAAGYRTNRELAARLHLWLNTIKTHLKNLYLKLEVRKRAEAILKVQPMP